MLFLAQVISDLNQKKVNEMCIRENNMLFVIYIIYIFVH